MNIAIPREVAEGEQRVAVVPDTVKKLVSDGNAVMIQSEAGTGAGHSDEAYRDAGASIAADEASATGSADLILRINPPTPEQVAMLRSGSILISLMQPLTNKPLVKALVDRNVTGLSLEMVPRITRAQSMDVLSSMSTVAGYRAVLMASAGLPRFMPMLVTAAGTIPPAHALILGAGVAGLQAIATARRLGAVVSAFDVRPAVKEQVESLGATFLAADQVDESSETAGGYAKELSEEQHKRELELIHEHIVKSHMVITTALIPGRPAPALITEQMVKDMPVGSVIVDLASEAGGNCELTRHGEDVVHHGVRIMGPLNLPGGMPIHASQMFSRNLATLLKHLIKDGELKIDTEDEITSGMLVAHEGAIANDRIRGIMEGASS